MHRTLSVYKNSENLTNVWDKVSSSPQRCLFRRNMFAHSKKGSPGQRPDSGQNIVAAASLCER